MSLATAGHLLPYLGKTCCLYALFDSCFNGRGLGGHLFSLQTQLYLNLIIVLCIDLMFVLYINHIKHSQSFCSSDNRVCTGLKSTLI